MSLNEAIMAELQQEATTTRAMLERIPEKSLTWKPHEKSMSLGRLAYHIAEIPEWMSVTVDQDEFDFAKSDYVPKDGMSKEEILKAFDDNLANALTCLKNASDEKLMGTWTMKNGDVTYFTLPKIAVVRSFVQSHSVHHRGQLSVYLRMLDVPLPQVYGPTADEGDM